MHINKYLIKIIAILLLSFLLLSPISFGFDSVYVWSDNVETVAPANNDNASSIFTTTPIDNSNSLKLESGSAILIEQNSGQVLYEHNSHEKLRPASVTNVMDTSLLPN